MGWGELRLTTVGAQWAVLSRHLRSGALHSLTRAQHRHVATHTRVPCLELSTHDPRHAAWPSNTPPSRFARDGTYTRARTRGDTDTESIKESTRCRVAAGGGPARFLYWLQEAENFLSATTTSASTTQVASRAAITMAAMAPGPSDPVEDRRPCYPSPSPQIQPRPGPSAFPPSHPPPSPLAAPPRSYLRPGPPLREGCCTLVLEQKWGMEGQRQQIPGCGLYSPGDLHLRAIQ